jgi:two-component system sensor histidine kinase/response regulator
MTGQPTVTLDPPLMHELRTPLNQILGYSEMLLEQAREEGRDEFLPDLEKVRTAGMRMLGIIDGNLSVRPEPVLSEPRLLKGSAEHVDVAGRVLVVDDDEGNRDVLSQRLRKQGYLVTSAHSGPLALNLLLGEEFDVVLLDVMMPDVDGYEVLRQIKGNESLKDIPVIMISALTAMDSVVKCIELGADDYLPKPFDATLLKARVGACLEKKRGRDREVALLQQVQDSLSRLQKSEELRDDLTSMIIHDLRTPLTSVIAAIQTLGVVGEMNEEQSEVVRIAMDGSSSLLERINSLLDVEKLESGAMALDISLISLRELVEAAVAEVASLADAKGLRIGKEIDANLPWVEGDEDKLQRVLVNLLGNAIKFTPTGGTISVQAVPSDSGSSVEICVRDTGEGIPEEAHARIFDKFSQVETRAAGRNMSTGLGLTFCKLSVEAHGGRIWVESVQGEGSAFHFAIPIFQARATAD